ncbi:RNA polymerase sigma factor [Streptomyces gibsoniae]|uniref:Sigma-70 family RNA polymerase sigma factor n=1 Tax=Streptomyces gibsoniae TaxID=3075529 RepID=A0ABU2TSQ2_9ACTN|nr:sigma-70 family RNA polymerase sigma factor [Streptomyces sp. DSM 41699]MDT0463887.1 sigma-70 family RNA polymerase sigma factor [Streptomyces sp. DSM 41699]
MRSIVGQESARAREARFETLMRAVADPLHRYLLRRADAGSVDDILAETMLVLWRRLDDVPGLGAGPDAAADDVLPWCYGVARGCLANARRAEGRRLRLVERLTRAVLPPPRPDDADHTALHDALAALSARDREVVLLWAWEELTPRAIAEVTGLTPNAVSIRLHRGKKRLAALLERKNDTQAGRTTRAGRSAR